MMSTGLSAADVIAMTRDGYTGNGNGNNDWVNNPFIYLVWLALLGNGGIFGNRGYGTDGASGGGASRSDLFEGFNNQDVNGQLRGITQGICDGFYAVNTGMLQGFGNAQSALCQGLGGVSAAIGNLGYQMQQCCCDTDKSIMQTSFQNQAGFNALATQLAQCCCDMKYDMATQACDTRRAITDSTRDIIDNQNSNTRAILDFLTQDKIATLTAENQSLKFAASQAAQNAFITANQEAQTAELIRRLSTPAPIPAYTVPNPNAYIPYAYGCGTGCGGCC